MEELMLLDCVLCFKARVPEALDSLVQIEPELAPLELDRVVLEEEDAPWLDALALARPTLINFVAKCCGKLHHGITARLKFRVAVNFRDGVC